MDKFQCDIVVIGAGPAGMSAALYGANFGYKVALIMDGAFGGKINSTSEVNNYLGFNDLDASSLVESFTKNIEDNDNIEVLWGRVASLDYLADRKVVVEFEDYSKVIGKTVLIASGTSTRKLGVPGEDLKDIHYCATCDGSFYKDKTVAILGGGDSAFEDALVLSNLCADVTLIHRSDTFRANKPLQLQVAQKENISVIKNTIVESFEDYDGGRDILLHSQNGNLFVNGVFIAIGQEPNNNFIPSSLLDEQGFVKTRGYSNHTLSDGIFVAGDIKAESHKQISIAVGDGASAAIQMKDYIEKFY